jgi:hypothetical protein
MTQTRKEWIVNGALAAAIALVLVLVGAQSFAPLPEDPVARIAAPATAPVAGAGMSETIYSNLSRRNIFRALVTRSPSPTPPPPTPTPTPDLSNAVGQWKYKYPFRSRNMYIFADKDDKEIELKAGEPFKVNDGSQDFEITVEPSGRYEVIIRYGDQSITKSMLE